MYNTRQTIRWKGGEGASGEASQLKIHGVTTPNIVCPTNLFDTTIRGGAIFSLKCHILWRPDLLGQFTLLL